MPAVPLTTTAKILALPHPSRKSITFTNPDSLAVFYITCWAMGTASPSTTVFDYVVGPGIALTLATDTDDERVVRSRFDGISDTATKTIGVAET